MLNIHGIAKPSYRAYQLLHRLGFEQLPVTGSHSTVDVWVVHDTGPRALSPKVRGWVQVKHWFQDLAPVYVAD